MRRLLYSLHEQIINIRILRWEYFRIRFNYIKSVVFYSPALRKFAKAIFWIAVTVGVILLAIIGYRYAFTGFGEFVDSSGNIQRGKTLWDWMDLLLIPLLLALAAYYFTKTQRDKDIEISTSGRQEEALQMYLDKMTELILTQNLKWRTGEISRIARARTLTILDMLSGKLKGRVLCFLLESDLLSGKKPFIDLESANLAGLEILEVGGVFNNVKMNYVILANSKLFGTKFCNSDLAGVTFENAELKRVSFIETKLDYVRFVKANLKGVDFEKSRLIKANFEKSLLDGANFCGAVLDRAIMKDASLYKANLSEASLQDSDLRFSNLRKADLTNADLTGANMYGADLRGANLLRANLSGTNLTRKQLQQAISIKDAVFPKE